MARNVTLCITSAGSVNGVNIIQALQKQKEIRCRIIATDSNPLSSGSFLSHVSYVVPLVTSKDFVPKILSICRKEKVDILIPAHSHDLPIIAEHRGTFEKIGVKIAISPPDVYRLTEDKMRAYEFFQASGIPFPKIYTAEDLAENKVRFPVVVKPNYLSGSKNVFRAHTAEINFLKTYIKDPIIQEFVEGNEYTIDGLCDLQGRMIAASPRIRLETRGGMAVKSMTVREPRMVAYTKKIVEGLGIVGPFNVQCFKRKEDGKLSFIEVNARFPSGGLPLTVGAGFNIPLLLVKMLLGMPIQKPKIKTGIVMVRYWDSIILKKQGKSFIRF